MTEYYCDLGMALVHTLQSIFKEIHCAALLLNKACSTPTKCHPLIATPATRKAPTHTPIGN